MPMNTASVIGLSAILFYFGMRWLLLAGSAR
jgi:hypothetical protein